ncbi:MAG: sodium:solute symporter family protein [Planctomycetes bacterium]|nr:sodium:solute symporter family protein [Planctomycetota bacterium]
MPYVWTILAYLTLLLGVGVYLARRVKGQEDFMVAGRRLTAPVLVGTLLATWIGSGDLFSVADLSYRHGYSSLIGSAGGWLGIVVVFFIAGRVRRFGQFTVPDILEARFDYRARILATITTVIAYVTIVSYQFRGGGWVIEMVSGGRVPESQAIAWMAAFVVLYALTAGMLSVAYLDVINGIVMLLGFFIAVPVLVWAGGGVSHLAENVTPRSHALLGNMSLLEALGYLLPTLLLALGNGNMYQRFFSARDEREARRSVVGWVVGAILLGVAIQTVAVAGSALFKGLPPARSGKIILYVAVETLPVWAGCILMAAIAAIVTSTATSFLLVPATNLVRDVYQRFVNPGLSDRRSVLLSRAVVVLLGGAAFLLIRFFRTVLEAAYAAYTVYGAGLTPALMATFFWKRATVAGGVWSIASGMGVTIAWEVSKKAIGHHPWSVPAVYPALAVSLAVLVVVSLAGAPPPREKWERFASR